jgi:hypothetical protein
MQFRTIPLFVVAVSALLASADKKLPVEKSSNELVEIAGVLLDKDEVVKEFGSDLGGGVLVMRTTVRPLSEKPVKIDYDDFFLLDTNSGQRSAPYEPSQIAGTGALVLTPNGVRNAGMASNPRGPSWGGIPGTGGRPRQLPGSGAEAGSSTTTTTTDTKVEAEKDAKPNPRLAALKEKILPQKEVTETITGLLYFQMEGKVKPKDLELTYKSPAGRLLMRFKPRLP